MWFVAHLESLRLLLEVTHTIYEDEWTGLIKHINALLAIDSDISHHHPLPAYTSVIFDDRKDGLVPAELGKDSAPDAIDERVLDGKGEIMIWLNGFHMTINKIISISSLDAVGCSVVNIGSATRETSPWRQNAVILSGTQKSCVSLVVGAVIGFVCHFIWKGR